MSPTVKVCYFGNTVLICNLQFSPHLRCGYIHKYLRHSLVTCPFSKTDVEIHLSPYDHSITRYTLLGISSLPWSWSLTHSEMGCLTWKGEISWSPSPRQKNLQAAKECWEQEKSQQGRDPRAGYPMLGGQPLKSSTYK